MLQPWIYCAQVHLINHNTFHKSIIVYRNGCGILLKHTAWPDGSIHISLLCSVILPEFILYCMLAFTSKMMLGIALGWHPVVVVSSPSRLRSAYFRWFSLTPSHALLCAMHTATYRSHVDATVFILRRHEVKYRAACVSGFYFKPLRMMSSGIVLSSMRHTWPSQYLMCKQSAHYIRSAVHLTTLYNSVTQVPFCLSRYSTQCTTSKSSQTTPFKINTWFINIDLNTIII